MACKVDTPGEELTSHSRQISIMQKLFGMEDGSDFYQAPQ